MRKYLASLPERSDSHKKTFALLVSGGFTLFIFAIWALVNLGTPSGELAEGERVEAESPLVSLGSGLAGALGAIKTETKLIFGVDTDEPEPAIENVESRETSSTVRTSAIEIYGE